MSVSTEDLYWTVSYDVESKPDFLTSIAKLSSAAYYNGANNPVYSIGFKGGAVSTKSYYHYNATDDDFTDFIETFKATGSFSVNYDTGAIAASITDGNLQSKTQYYLTDNLDTTLDEREMIDYSLGYDTDVAGSSSRRTTTSICWAPLKTSTGRSHMT